jgi:hypothetical protein
MAIVVGDGGAASEEEWVGKSDAEWLDCAARNQPLRSEVMSTRSAVIQVEPDLAEAFNAAPKQEQERVKSAMRNLLRLVPPAPKKARRLSKKETELFLKINRGLSDKQRRRLDELNEKIEESILSNKEHAELLRLTDRVEKLWVERLRAIIDLAKLRKMAPEELMRQLEIEPPSYDN